MSNIDIRLIGITDLDTDCIVNAANSGLAMGSGVCGAIFRAAGPHDMQAACNAIGGCPTGGAVITQIGIYVGKNFRIFKNEKGWKMLVFALIISVLVSAVLDKKILEMGKEAASLGGTGW